MARAQATSGRHGLLDVMTRAGGLLLLWFLLRGPHVGSLSELLLPAELAIGALATFCGVWASLRLLPPLPRVRPTRVAELLLHHLWQALRAGSEVALWALQRAPPIRPGVLPFQPRLRRGPRAELFAALSCLAPGTLPIETEADGSLLYHCLDVHRPVGQSLASDEARLARVTRADGTVDGAMTR